jgi:hypothetical protein
LQAGKTVPEEKWRDKLNLQIEVSKSLVTYSPDPATVPDFEDFEVIPSIGVGATPP